MGGKGNPNENSCMKRFCDHLNGISKGILYSFAEGDDPPDFILNNSNREVLFVEHTEVNKIFEFEKQKTHQRVKAKKNELEKKLNEDLKEKLVGLYQINFHDSIDLEIEQNLIIKKMSKIIRLGLNEGEIYKIQIDRFRSLNVVFGGKKRNLIKVAGPDGAYWEESPDEYSYFREAIQKKFRNENPKRRTGCLRRVILLLDHQFDIFDRRAVMTALSSIEESKSFHSIIVVHKTKEVHFMLTCNEEWKDL